jgi:hypothetical protein
MNAIGWVHIRLPAYNEEAALPRLLQRTNSSVRDLYAEHLCRAYPDCDVSSRLALLRCFKLIHPIRGVRDYTCGYRGYRVSALKRPFGRYGEQLIGESGFSCMPELLFKLNALGLRSSEIPLRLRYDLKPTASKMNVGNNISRLLRLLVQAHLRGFGSSNRL